MSGTPRDRLWRDGEVIDGRYKVIRLAGEGGMGRVYQVRHLQWGIDLAIKQLKQSDPDAPLGPGDIEDFEKEAEAWVSLGLHPNLCCCHYVRQIGGESMVFGEYVPGGSLRDWIKHRWLYEGTAADALRRVLDVAIQFAWGLEHAHQRGMVHQDVKPENVLLDASDGEISVKVTDFGLARARPGISLASPDPGAEAGQGASVRVSVGGWTPQYASPEQLARKTLSRRTDVYSYAVSVLEMFTGKRLWRTGDEAGQALSDYLAGGAARQGMPPMPTALGLLLQRCLREKPEDREDPDNPGTGLMAGIAAEIAAIYQSEVHAPYPRMMPRAADLRADELNNRALSLLDLGRMGEAEETFAAARKADPRHLEATYNDGLRQWRSGAMTDDVLIGRLEAARTASGDSWLARYLLAEVHLERGDLTAACELLHTVEHKATEEPSVANALRTVRSGQLVGVRRAKIRTMSWHEYEGDGIPPMTIRFTADGQRALALSGKHLGLWDVESGQRLVRLRGQHDPHTYADISGDGRFALWGRDARVGLQDLTSGDELWRAKTGAKSYEWIAAVSLSADARIAATVLSTVVTSSDRDNVMVWDARSGRLRVRLGEHSGVIPAELSPDGRFALTSGREDHTARLWDTGTGTCVRELHRGDWNVSAMSISPDARTAAVALKDIGIWDLTTGRQIRTLTGHNRVVRSLSWSRDGQFLLSAADYDNVRLWDAGSGRCVRNFPYTGIYGLSHPTLLLAPDDGSPIVADEEAVRWWPLPIRYSAPPQLSRPRRHVELTRLADEANALAESAEQAIAAHRYSEAHGLLTKARAIPGYERDPRMLSAWRSLTSVLPQIGVRASWQVREFDSEYYGAVDLSPDGARAVSNDRYMLRVWDARTGRCLRTIDHPSRVNATRLSPDQRRVASAASCGQIGVWSIDTGRCLMKITSRQNDRAYWTHFSADGRWALSDAHESVRLWDLDSGQCVRTVASDGCSPLSLTPDGSRAVTSARDHVLRIWDMGTGRCLGILAGHTSRIGVVSVSPEGNLAVSGDKEKTVRVWDLGSGDCMHVLRDLPDRLCSIQFVNNGRFVMTGGARGTIQIWDPRTGRCLHTFNSGRTEVMVVPTPDGRLALSHGGDVPLRLWEFDWELATSST